MINQAISMAQTSKLNNKHGAILFSGSTIYSKSVNSDRTRILKSTYPSEHAEMSCLMNHFKEKWHLL